MNNKAFILLVIVAMSLIFMFAKFFRHDILAKKIQNSRTGSVILLEEARYSIEQAFNQLSDRLTSLENRVQGFEVQTVRVPFGWKTYSRDEQDFSFSYPGDWTIDQVTPLDYTESFKTDIYGDARSILLIFPPSIAVDTPPEDLDRMQLVVFQNENKMSVQDFIEDTYGPGLRSTKKITRNGIVMEYYSFGMSTFSIWNYKNDIFVFEDATNSYQTGLFDDILTTINYSS